MPGLMLLLLTRSAHANPTGMTVVSGTASARQSGPQLTVTAGNNAFVNWQSFNIGAGETTIFNQPSASSIVWNRVNDPNPSQIYGTLQANGVVVLLNSSGFYFGPNSFVSAAGLVVSTANCVPPQNSGGSWEFNGPPPLASIVNYGQIKIGSGGDCYLIADKIENHGDIEAPGGTVGLAAGQNVLLSERPDGRGMSMQVKLPQGSVDNYGQLIADAGTIELNAKVVNQNGFIQANSVQNVNGVIELVASDSLNLGAASQMVANGDASASGSNGGQVTLKSENIFSDANGSEISVAGGANAGNGGEVEISAPVMPAIHTTIDGHAQPGSAGGKLFLDPDYIILDGDGADSANGGTVLAGDDPGGTLDLNVYSAFTGFSQITLQAKYDITLADDTSWSLSDSTGQSTGNLYLEAGRNIIFGNTTALYDFNNWSIALFAGVTGFTQPTAGGNFTAPTVAPGAGSIYLNANDPNNPNSFAYDPSGYIQTAAGSITMVAGQGITVGTGRVTTTDGGGVMAHALAGNIDTGGYAQGYVFQSGGSAADGYYVDPSIYVGGISTTAGGDVSLIAGGNVNSILPAQNGYYYDGGFVSSAGNSVVLTAGSGAYGFGSGEMGNVTVVAGGNVTGNYLEGNGTGNIFAGVKMDAGGNPIQDASGNYVLGGTGSAGTNPTGPDFALSLISGGWNVTAAQNIILQEVSNPNGDFNINRGDAYHAFDYAPSDYVNLTAGNLVQLGASSSLLPRLNSVDSLKVPVIYPGILNIIAGAGGVVLTGDSTYNQLILYPSPLGSLTIKTADGGSLTGSLPAIGGAPQIFSLIVSDSGNHQYTSSSGGIFGLNDHAATPVHLGSETPLTLNISGDMNYVLLGVPEAAQVTVVGDMNNCRFQGMNLAANDVTSIDVTGDINNRSAFTSIDLSQVSGAGTPDLSLLPQAVPGPGDPSAPTLVSSFYYNPATHILTYQTIPGQNLASVLALLQNLTVQVYQNGVPQWADPPFDTVPLTTTVSVIDSATAQALLTEYNTLGPTPAGTGGYAIGGGGTFEISAAKMDLGTTTGIQSKGVGLYKVGNNYPLAALSEQGADIDINLTGDLTMYSSSIASLNGGNISINAGGEVNVGSSDFTVNSLAARGIFSTGQGNVSVVAGGDVNVNGSRIAAYDGGNVTVESLNGDISAGTGGGGFVTVNSFSVAPGTHQVSAYAVTIPGSGILATTFPNDAGQAVGNILVETPNGDVNASAGGIVQLPLNGVNTARSIVEILAGSELRNAGGNPVFAADITSGTPAQVSAGRNIDASGSGVIGSTVDLNATGDIIGLVFARNNINLNAQQNINVTALAQGNVSVSSGGTISGTIVGVGGVSASGSSIDASLLSQNVSASGDTSGAKQGFAQGTAANATSQGMANDNTAAAASNSGGTDDDSKTKKKISLAQKVSGVTVLLPEKN